MSWCKNGAPEGCSSARTTIPNSRLLPTSISRSSRISILHDRRGRPSLTSCLLHTGLLSEHAPLAFLFTQIFMLSFVLISFYFLCLAWPSNFRNYSFQKRTKETLDCYDCEFNKSSLDLWSSQIINVNLFLVSNTRKRTPCELLTPSI